jgi:hypothetical protein
MANSGGSFLPAGDYDLTGTWDFSDATVTLPDNVTEDRGSIALTDTTNQIATGTGSNITTSTFPASSGAVTLTFPSTTDTVVGRATTDTLTNKTLTSPTVNGGTFTGTINADYKILAANATYSATVTPATLTGFSWTVVAGTYTFELNMPATMTTNGGLTINFLLTTAVLTSIQYQSYAATASDNTTAVSTNGTTTTSGTKVFDDKTAAYTHVNIKGSMVVGTGGTFAWQGCQNTSAGAGDATVVSLGSYARMTRVS